MKYFYARVSAKDQNLARQLLAAKEYERKHDFTFDKIFEDKKSGKNFDRKEYLRLKNAVVEGDEVFVKELDRYGRNKQEIKNEIAWFNQRKVIVRILDIPTTLLDFHGQDWIREMINNIIIEVLASMAEQEREKILCRQAEGIAAMPVINGRKVSAKTGRGFGRPKLDDSLISTYVEKVQRGELSVSEACKQLKISRQSWYTYRSETL